MQRSDEFRLYYNHTIHPELLRLERKRVRVVRLMVVLLMVVLPLMVFFLSFYGFGFQYWLMLVLLIGIFVFILWRRVRRFVGTFKPHIISLILDFVDNAMNYGTFSYNYSGFIPQKTVIASQLFGSKFPHYEGEDYIKGTIGDVSFQMCELDIRNYSPVLNQFNPLFKGVFCQASLGKGYTDQILVFPQSKRVRLTRVTKDFLLKNGADVTNSKHISPDFRKIFFVLASPDANIRLLLSPEMQASLLDYQEQTDRAVYVSFINDNIHIAADIAKDIFEPRIFASNVSFDLVYSFYNDIDFLVSIVEDFDMLV
jgi:Protein of unknown function (DUF3137)